MDLVKSIVTGYLRHGLTAAAGYLLAHGLIQTGDQQVLISAGLAAAGLAWSTVNKLAQNRLELEQAQAQRTANPKS
jgi:hypothetical protein